MKTTPVTHEDLSSSVLAVPPLARHADLSLNNAANKALIHHM
ncbi:MAG: dihydrodipicolinate synthase family protein, partial [Burkholderiaceae bacterium]